MGTKSYRGREQSRPDVDAGILFGSDSASGRGRGAHRKERQLCRQVHEAIGEAIATLRDEVLLEVWVAGVEPAPDASRLAVLVQASSDVSPDEVKERLLAVMGFLRTEVAQAITRKRVPTLTFEVLPGEPTG